MSKLKSEVAPKGINFRPATEFMLGDKDYTIMTVVGYPRSIFPGYLSDITNIPGVRLAIKHIPIKFIKLVIRTDGLHTFFERLRVVIIIISSYILNEVI